MTRWPAAVWQPYPTWSYPDRDSWQHNPYCDDDKESAFHRSSLPSYGCGKHAHQEDEHHPGIGGPVGRRDFSLPLPAWRERGQYQRIVRQSGGAEGMVGTSSVNSEESECHMMVPYGYRNLMSNFTCWLRYVPKVRCQTVPVPVRAYELFKPAFKQFKRWNQVYSQNRIWILKSKS